MVTLEAHGLHEGELKRTPRLPTFASTAEMLLILGALDRLFRQADAIVFVFADKKLLERIDQFKCQSLGLMSFERGRKSPCIDRSPPAQATRPSRTQPIVKRGTELPTIRFILAAGSYRQGQ